MAMRARDLLDKKREQLAVLGSKAREEARAAGVSAYFIDKNNPDFITEERPDGTRVIVDRVEQPGKFAAE